MSQKHNMKTLMLFLSFLIADLISFGQSSYSRYTDVIPAGGHTVTFHCCSNPQLCQVISVSTGGSAVNLGGNTYTLTYDSLPDKMQWDVYCNFSQLTLNNANQVTIFGVQPLVNWPAADTFVIHFVVLLNNGSKVLWYNYVSPQVSVSGVVPGNITFNGIVTANDSILYPGAPLVSGTQNRGATLTISPTSGAIARGCNLTCKDSLDFWSIFGNLGLGGLSRFLGTNDTANLNFRVNGINAGVLSSTSSSTGFGYQTLNGLLTITGFDAAYGWQALKSLTSGASNTGIGALAGTAITNGANNTAIGYSALSTITTGNQNTAIGNAADGTVTASSNIVAIGYNAKSASTGIAIGSGATAVSNQCTLNGVRSLNMPSIQSSGVGYVLTDSTGLGNFVAMPTGANNGTTYTPVTGDSVTISTPKNAINPAGTIANWTAILPSTIVNWQVYEFSFLQAVSTVHWSIRLSGGTVSAGVPTTAAQYATIKIYYNPTLTQWVLY